MQRIVSLGENLGAVAGGRTQGLKFSVIFEYRPYPRVSGYLPSSLVVVLAVDLIPGKIRFDVVDGRVE